MEKLYYRRFDTPLGAMWGSVSDTGLTQFHVAGTVEALRIEAQTRYRAELVEDPRKLENVKNQLDGYFRHEKKPFTLPLDLRGTPFQVSVWKALCEVPEGKLASYGQIAEKIGKPAAVRAVANAVGDNPISLIVPCHRIVYSSGGIGGYTGGLEHKRRLLNWEGVLARSEGIAEKGIDLRKHF